MRKFKILIASFAIAAFCVQNVTAQETEANEEKEVYKTTLAKTPSKVKASLKDYSNYKIAEEVTYVRKDNNNIYKFRVEKGNWSHYLLIDEKGKIIGIETGEH